METRGPEARSARGNDEEVSFVGEQLELPFGDPKPDGTEDEAEG